ncbi:MAG: 3'-5' exonuclease [Pseudomonadota bacterium]
MSLLENRQLGLCFDDSPPVVTFDTRAPRARRGKPATAVASPVASAAPVVELPLKPALELPLAAPREPDAVAIEIAVPDDPSAASPITPAPLSSLTPAQMAEALEQHPDFRVLRRLVPSLHFPGEVSERVMKVLVLDTETTGLNSSRDKLVELALLRVHVDLLTGKPVGAVDVYDGLEDPGIPMTAESSAVTGISDEMLRGQSLDEARIAELIEGVDLVVAHNAGFDRPFVEARLPQFAQLRWACSFADIDWKAEGRSSSKLSALALELGMFYDAHRAEMDCHALLAVLLPALREGARNGMAQLLASIEAPSFKLQASAAPFDAKDVLKARAYRWDAAAKVWHTRLSGEAAFEAECQWLRSAVYGGRAAKVQYERLDALVKYSARPGQQGWREL